MVRKIKEVYKVTESGVLGIIIIGILIGFTFTFFYYELGRPSQHPDFSGAECDEWQSIATGNRTNDPELFCKGTDIKCIRVCTYGREICTYNIGLAKKWGWKELVK